MRGVRIDADVLVDGGLAQVPQDRAVHLPPHGRAVRHVVLPVDVQPRVLPRHDLLVAERLLLGGVLEPLELVLVKKLRRQLRVVAGVRQPAERYHVEVAPARACLRRSASAWLHHDAAHSGVLVICGRFDPVESCDPHCSGAEEDRENYGYC